MFALIEVSAYLSTQTSNLGLSRSLVRYKTGRHPVAWSFPTTYIPSADTMWDIAWMLQIDCRMAAHQGDYKRAFDDIRSVGPLFDTWSRRELLAVIHTRQCNAVAAQAQWAMEALALGEARDEELASLQDSFLELSGRNHLPDMLFFQRAFDYKMMEHFRGNFDGPAYMSLIPCGSYARLGWPDRVELELAWQRYLPHAGSDMAAILRRYTEALGIAKANGKDMRTRMVKLDDRAKKAMDGGGFDRHMLGCQLKPSFAAHASIQWECMAAASMAAIGLACERYRLEQRAWPEKLADLKPKFLGEIPVDPFTSSEFHYARLPDGIAVYRVPEGTVDHGGTYWDMRRVLSPLRWRDKEGKDLRGEPKARFDDPAFVGPPEYVERIDGWARGGKGFRLWNPEIRKKPLTTVVVHERPAVRP